MEETREEGTEVFFYAAEERLDLAAAEERLGGEDAAHKGQVKGKGKRFQFYTGGRGRQ